MIYGERSRTIEQLRKNIDASLASFLQTVKKDYKLHLVSPLLFESIREFTLRKGKRLRPLLLILTYKAYSPPDKKITRELYNASTCMEFLHNFMLIHDDIIDRSHLRRGKPTLHKVLAKTVDTSAREKLGIDLGIIAGDIVYALAIDAFLSIQEPLPRKERALKYFIQTAAFTAMGEFIDTVHSAQDLDQISEKDVFLNYTLKTARYTFDCPMVTGAILADAPEGDIPKISQFGILIGQAFQIQDDMIGIFETEKNIGKPILSDLAEGKKTILAVHAYRTLKGPQRAQFLKIFHKKTKTLGDLEKVKTIFIEAGSLGYALRAVKTRLAQAQKILSSLKMNQAYRILIEQSLLKLFSHSQKIVDSYQPHGQLI
ncbi:MAG: polyprenyl synthetase family protein [Candidatus Omnitrophica bacterium]|nr:polyprenyl synthetase family protein [Candidatus Omnitrophota bacterium]